MASMGFAAAAACATLVTLAPTATAAAPPQVRAANHLSWPRKYVKLSRAVRTLLLAVFLILSSYLVLTLNIWPA